MKKMKKIIILSAALFAAAAQGQTMNDNRELAEIYRTINTAMQNADTTTLDKLLDDNFTLTHITGYVQPKAEWLADVKSGRMKYLDIREAGVTAERNGDTARIVGQARTTANIWGTEGTWRLQLDYRAEKQGSGWKVMKAVATLF